MSFSCEQARYEFESKIRKLSASEERGRQLCVRAEGRQTAGGRAEAQVAHHLVFSFEFLGLGSRVIRELWFANCVGV